MDTDELLTYIEQNIKEDISLVDLAQVVHYSPRQIYYIIKEATGMPVMSYIRYRRLLNAVAETTAIIRIIRQEKCLMIY